MIGTIRKHQQWLWMIIITLTVISFVIFFSPYTRVSDALVRGPGGYGSIYGEAVTAESYRAAAAEVFLRYFLSHGNWPDKDPQARQMGFDEEREAYYRLLLLQKQKELSIRASTAAVAQLATEILRQLNRGNPLPFDVFEKQVLQPRGLTAADFERFLRHEVGMQQLISVTGITGKLVMPQDAETLYRHDHEEVSAEAVFFSATNFLANVSASADAVAQFYTNQMPNYRLPERLQVSYVEFELTNFWTEADAEMDKMTNLTAIVDNVYRERGTNYYSEAQTPEEAKELVKKDIRRDLALVSARKKATEFASTLLDQESVRAENLDKLAAEKGLAVKVTAPFDREDGPEDLKVRDDFTRRAFSLTSEEPVTGPIVGEDGVYVIALKKQIPSEIPPLDTIRDKVKTDCEFAQAVQLARQAGTNFYTTLTNGLVQGKTFTSICREAKLAPLLLPPFSRSTRSLPEIEDRVSLGLLQQITFRVDPGKVSNFISMLDGGFIVHVQSRLPLDEAKLKTELPDFMAYLRQVRQNEAFQEWFRKQAEQGLRNTPLARAQQQQQESAAAKK